MKLERLVRARRPKPASASGWRVEFDASIYGGGAVLRAPGGDIDQYFTVVWQGNEAPHLNIIPGETRFQTFWEFATLFLALLVWADFFVDTSLAVLGDNTGALTNALQLKGRGPLLAIAREISWRKARRSWAFEVGHLPSEHNSIADALSRIADPKETKGWPSKALAAARAVTPPRLSEVWRAVPR